MRLRRRIRDEAVAPVSFFACQDIMFAAGGVFLLVSILLSLFGKMAELSYESVEESGKREALRTEARTHARLSRQLALLEETVAVGWGAAPAEGEVPQSDEIWLLDPQALADENAPLQKSLGILRRRLSKAATEMNRREVRLGRLQAGGWEQLLQGGRTIVRTGRAHVFREPLFIRLHRDGPTLEWLGRPELDESFAEPQSLLAYVDARFSPENQSILILLQPTGIDDFKPTIEGLRQRGYSVGYEPTPEPVPAPQP